MYFDKFDICEAYYMYAMNYHDGQWSKEYAIFGRLINMKFRMKILFTSSPKKELTTNGFSIYMSLVQNDRLGHSKIRSI